MKHASTLIGGVCALLGSLPITGPGSQAQGAEVPIYLKSIVGTQAASAAEVGTKNILQLNTSMFELYDNSSKIFQTNFLAQHPVILGLFSGAGGRFILYRPGKAPIEAPSVPIVYQLMKSVGHSTMALAEVVMPYLDSPNDQTWRARWRRTGAGCNPRSTASRRPRCGTTGGQPTAPSCRTILRSWTNV